MSPLDDVVGDVFVDVVEVVVIATRYGLFLQLILDVLDRLALVSANQI